MKSTTPLQHVLVSGGSGFLGSAIVRSLLELHPNCRISIIDTATPSKDRFFGLDAANGVTVDFYKGDVTKLEEMKQLLQKIRPQIVIHSAGIVPPLSERYSRRMEKTVKLINVEGTRNMLEAAKDSHVQAFVYTSSCCAVTDDMTQPYANIDERWPTSENSSHYGESKVAAEALILAANSTDQQGMKTCVLRPAVIFGEGDQQLVPPIHACIAKGETPYRIGNGRNLWDVVYVGNVADAHVLAADNLVNKQTAAGEVFFIQNNQPISFRDFTLAIWKEFNHYPVFEVSIPEGLGWALGFLAEMFTWISGTTTTLSRGSILDACAMRYASGDKAKRILGYEPRVGLEEGLKRSCLVSTDPLSSLCRWCKND